MKFFTFQGRASRASYTLHIFGGMTIFVVVIFLAYKLIPPDASHSVELLRRTIFWGAFSAMLADSIFVGVRRLHDLNRPGFHYFLHFVPIYNIVFVLQLLLQRGTDGPNSFDLRHPGAELVTADRSLMSGNVYATSSTERDAGPTLYSIQSIELATFLGSCFAGSALISQNFARTGNDGSARKSLVLGFVSLVMLALLIFLIRGSNKFNTLTVLIVAAIQIGALRLVAVRTQGDLLKQHADTGGSFFPKWKAAGVSLLLLPVAVAVFIGITTLPNLLALAMKDQFRWQVQVAAQTEDHFTERGVTDWGAFSRELNSFPWMEQLREARTLRQALPTIMVLNPRLDRSLRVSIVGMPDDYVFHCFWQHLRFHHNARVWGVKSVKEVSELFSLLFERKVENLDKLFDSYGITAAEYSQLFNKGGGNQ